MPNVDIDAIVFDVLGTLVDEPAGIRAGIRALDPALGASEIEHLLALWQRHVDGEQRRVREGVRPYAPSDVLDREAARLVVDASGADPALTGELALSGRRLPPWADTVAGLDRLAERYRLIGLSNASRTSLLELSAHAGLRWHTALSAEEAGTYKPDPAVYRLAVAASGRPPERLLMVATHAWDLRGAQRHGLRCAYVARSVGDPPAAADSFALYADGLADLAGQLEGVDDMFG
ncbi:haloacid dehalogenase type II [Streptomyces sp. NPDC005476]|uniref:haloacid dehalogenase type II n=1 Tax=Streptomyces sp. NPDC005476 TaxID=3156882 RepID=UPI00345333C0